MRSSLVPLCVALIAVVGCGDEEPLADPAASVPRAGQHLIESRTDVVEVECSEEDGFVEDVLDDAYQAVDLLAFPDAACVVELEDGSILDLMLMQGKWFKFKRDNYG